MNAISVLSQRPAPHAGFSLVELLIVLLIVVVLTSLLMPGLRAVRETANRLGCASNLRQIGCAITVYSTDYDDRLPFSYFGSPEIQQFSEMMALTTGGGPTASNSMDGLGRLLPRAGHYLDCAGCMFCPSHRGEHTIERYQATLDNPWESSERAFSNYHYRGDVDSESGVRYRFSNDHSFLLAADGLRTKSDFNHGNGLNLLHGDLAVTWLSDTDGSLIGSLPEAPADFQPPVFDELWTDLVKVEK